MENKRTFFSNRTYEVIWGEEGVVCPFQNRRSSGGIDPYQRGEGRNLFDWYKPPAQKQFLANMNGKMTDTEFGEDARMILNEEQQPTDALSKIVIKNKPEPVSLALEKVKTG
jgi:hypothetical protein